MLSKLAIKKTLRATLLILVMTCSGCVSGLSVPSDDVWDWVVATTTHEHSSSNATALEARIKAEFTPQLPMTVREFEDMLKAENFECSWSPDWRSKPGTINTRDCLYFQRGPIQRNACISGERVAISISFSYPNEDRMSTVTTFDAHVIMEPDASAHSSRICFPL